MIIQGGAKQALNQDALKSKSSKNSDRSSFEEMLANARQSKSTKSSKARNKKTASKKSKQNLAGGEDVQQQREYKNPVKKHSKQAGAQQVDAAKTSHQDRAKQDQPVQQGKTLEAVSIAQANSKKMMQVQNLKQEAGDSLNLSVSQNETLGKNLKISENPFEQMMAKVQQAQGQAAPNAMASQIKQSSMNPALAQIKSKNEGFKIPSELKMTESPEGLESQVESLLSKVGPTIESDAQATGDQTSTQMDSLFTQHMEKDLNQTQATGSVFAEELATVGKEEGGQKIENMNSIIKQARTFVKDGGGSMEIHLQPEGLGKVQLKVNVENGQVNVEMLADNMAAKRALEEGLFDVKQALEGQKLVVDTLKVEMGQDYQRDFSDLQDHAREQANRDFAEQFLGQFRQERDERMTGMFDSFRSFQPEMDQPELKLNKNNPYSHQGKGRTINMVA